MDIGGHTYVYTSGDTLTGNGCDVYGSVALRVDGIVAARRFDGQTQRLRISIEEDGLEFLAEEPLVPSVTPDRLRTALSLMADCGLIGWDDSRQAYFVQ